METGAVLEVLGAVVASGAELSAALTEAELSEVAAEELVGWYGRTVGLYVIVAELEPTATVVVACVTFEEEDPCESEVSVTDSAVAVLPSVLVDDALVETGTELVYAILDDSSVAVAPVVTGIEVEMLESENALSDVLTEVAEVVWADIESVREAKDVVEAPSVAVPEVSSDDRAEDESVTEATEVVEAVMEAADVTEAYSELTTELSDEAAEDAAEA
ncbi:hypothetical protein LTR65_007463 [Meristemomyces frigidus]